MSAVECALDPRIAIALDGAAVGGVAKCLAARTCIACRAVARAVITGAVVPTVHAVALVYLAVLSPIAFIALANSLCRFPVAPHFAVTMGSTRYVLAKVDFTVITSIRTIAMTKSFCQLPIALHFTLSVGSAS